MSGLFDGTPLERPVTCEVCEQPMTDCRCPRNAAGTVLLPSDQAVQVRLEKRKNGRLVTVIQGIDPHATHLPSLLRELKRHCGTGGAANDDTLEVQGDHQETATAFLQEKGFNLRRARP